MKDSGRKPSSRKYQPNVEALEALRLLSDGLVPTLTPPPVEIQFLDTLPAAPDVTTLGTGSTTWDAALGQTRLTDLLGTSQAQTEADPDAIRQGLSQLDRYLCRAWARAGIPPQQHEDCTQAVYATLLQNLGRDGFDHLIADVGQNGVREVFSRDTAEGPDFFRAVDMVKKRAQREKTFQTIDDYRYDLADNAGGDGASADWRGALNEAIERNLNSREASLIHDTLQGKTPAEIAEQWGVAPKTVSNEKTRVLHKLRKAMVDDLTAA